MFERARTQKVGTLLDVAELVSANSFVGHYDRGVVAALNAIPRPYYTSALQVGCSIDVFTNALAARCERLLAIDASLDVLDQAQRNCADQSNVRFERRAIPHEYPSGPFDLITICEIGLYLNSNELRALRELVTEHSAPGAHAVLVHLTPCLNGEATAAQEVHRIFRECREFTHLHGFSVSSYRLDVLERR